MYIYFKDINSLEELRKQYKELLKKYHPDNGGDVAIMQEVNAEYDKLFQMLKNKHENDTTKEQTSYNQNMYDWENDRVLREVLAKIIHFSGIEILICGQWIWLDGNTFSYKKELKEMGFKWASQKKKWYFHTDTFRKKSRKTLSMEDIQNYYGSTTVKAMDRKQIAQA